MLTDIGVSHVIIGHSERREYFSEDNAYLAQKLRHTLENNLIPIFCCGETLATRKAGEQNQFVLNQLEESFSAFTPDDLSTLVIAYEPIWAIGTGETASPEQAQEMHAAIRSWLAQRFSPDFAAKTPILYGGSVKANNAVELFGQADIDGGLVGGASLLIDQFAAIANAF
jgi:triosephosphate isomerase